MLVLQGSCTWATKVLSFICCDCSYGAISLSQSSQLSPQPASAIDYLGHCQRLIRTRLTVCWLMLNQEKTPMMPVHLQEEVSSCTEKDLFPSPQRIPTFVTHITDTGAAPAPPAALQLSPCKESFLHGQLARELLPFVSDITLSTITHFLKIRLWHHIAQRKLS